MRVIGIDPGLDGALCYHDTLSGEVSILDMPTITVKVGTGAKAKNRRRVDPHAVLEWLVIGGQVDLVVLESSLPRPGEGAQGAFTMGRGWGILEGLLTALQRPWRVVTPQAWTKALAVGPDKGVHRETAMRLFPNYADQFRLVKHDGRADAALMSYWGATELGRG